MKPRILKVTTTSALSRWGIAITVVTAIAGVITFGYYKASNISPQVVIINPHVTLPTVAATPGTSAKAAPTTPAQTPLPDETRTAMLDRLIASGNAADAQRAFRIINQCVAAQKFEPFIAAASEEAIKAMLKRNVPQPGTACEGVMAGHLTQTIPLAIKAAQAGLPKSYLDLWGMTMYDRAINDDPQYKAAFPAIRDAAVKRADPDALMGRFMYVSNCADPGCTNVDNAEALKLWTAYIDAKGLPGKNADTATAQLSKILGPEKAAVAIQQGHQLVADARNTQ